MNQIATIESDAVVATMNRARLALAEAKTIQETKRIVDAAAAAEIYAKRQRLGEETSDLALSIKVEALRKLGEMLADKPKQAGARGTAGPGRGKNGVPQCDSVLTTPTLTDLGLTKKESAVAQKLAALSDDAFQQVRTGAVTVSKAIAAVDATKRADENGVATRNPVFSKRKAEPEPDDAPDGFDAAEELEHAHCEIKALQEQLEALEATDQGAELAKQIRIRQGTEMRLGQEMDKVSRLDRQLRDFGKKFDALRKLTGALTNAEVVTIVKRLTAKAA